MGGVKQKVKSQTNSVNTRGHIFCSILLKFVRMFALIISWTSSKMGHTESITRSTGQILEKPCVHHIGHIFSPALLREGQNVCLDDISDEFENRSCWCKN